MPKKPGPLLPTASLRGLLYDLSDINHHSLVEVLARHLSERGYEPGAWWEE